MENIPDFIKMFGDNAGVDSSTFESIFGMLQSSGNSSDSSDNKSTENKQTFEMPDIETIMKIKKIMDSLNQSAYDPASQLLSSLKPFLRDEKKSKVDQYIKLLRMGKVMSNFNDFGGDSK